LAEIQRYVEHSGCLMEFLARALDDPSAAPCGKCMNCTGRTDRQTAPVEIVQAAAEFLRSDAVVLEPRERWPKPMLAEVEKVVPEAIERYDNGRAKVIIPERLRPQPGRVLCVYGDAGWGQTVARGKYGTGTFDQTLVEAAASLIAGKWHPGSKPEWVTAIPSQRHPELIQDFAKRLAAMLGLPFLPVLRKRGTTAQQKEMQNSSMQLRNLLKAFQVIDAPAEKTAGAETQMNTAGTMVRQASRRVATMFGAHPVIPWTPVLLVDDVVDSGWTLTLASVLLLLNGSGPVYPFALAKASLRGG
jgi:ATP-dependent DNA helicase RecQ